MENRDLSSIARQLFALMAWKPGERVLHLNCGDGWATRMAAQAVSGATGMAAGLDISQDRIAQARVDSREVDNVLFAVGAAEEIPWRDEFFDGIFALEGFADFANPEPLLREAHRVLTSGGRLFMLVDEHPVFGDGTQAKTPPAGDTLEARYRQSAQALGFADITSVEFSACEDLLLWMARKP